MESLPRASPPLFVTLRACGRWARRLMSTGEKAAVDEQNGALDEAGVVRSEKRRSSGHVVGCARMAQQDPPQHPLLVRTGEDRRAPLSRDRTGRDGIHQHVVW